MKNARDITVKILLPFLASVAALTVLLFLASRSASCYNPAGGASGFTEDFYYEVVRTSKGDYVRLDGFTPKAQTKEEVLVPLQIRGLPVRSLYQMQGCGYRGNLKSENLKKLFMPKTNFYGRQFICEKLEKIILYNYTENFLHELSYFKSSQKIKLYVSSQYILPDNQQITSELFLGDGIKAYAANVSYMCNYESAPNYGYYFIDDCDYSSVINFVPPEPVRFGYSFGGWYREPECETVWNFETDTLPQARVDGDIECYTETKLYAKWIPS